MNNRKPFNPGLGALYGLLILHIMPASVPSCVAVNAFKGTENLKVIFVANSWYLNPVTERAV